MGICYWFTEIYADKFAWEKSTKNRSKGVNIYHLILY